MTSNESSREFDTMLPEDHFISRHLDFGTNLTDAHPEYHLGTSLGLLSVIVDRNVQMMVTPDPMFPNFWVLLLGQSTVSRKSTALNIAERVLESADLSDKVLPDDFSPEAFVQELEQRPQSAFIKDEFGELLAKMDRSYQSGVGELLCEMYNSPNEYERVLRSGEFHAEEVYLTLIGACVPAQTRYLSMADVGSGFIPRMTVIWPDRSKARKPIEVYEPENADLEESLAYDLRQRHEFLKEIANHQENPVQAIPSTAALSIYNDWCEDIETYIANSDDGEDLAPVAGRTQQNVLKIACLIELGSNEMLERLEEGVSGLSGVSRFRRLEPFSEEKASNSEVEEDDFSFTISEESMKVAIHYAHNIFLPDARRLVTKILEDERRDDIRRIYNIALRHVDEDGKISRSKLLQNTGVYADELDRCVNTLEEANLLLESEMGDVTYYVPRESADKEELPEVSFNLGKSLNIDGNW